MHSKAAKQMVDLAKGVAAPDRSFLDVVKKALAEAGIDVVVPSILRKLLEAAGYVIEAVAKNHGVQISIKAPLGDLCKRNHAGAHDFHACETRDPKAAPPDPKTLLLVASAYSHSEPDALLQAVYAECASEASAPPAGKVVA